MNSILVITSNGSPLDPKVGDILSDVPHFRLYVHELEMIPTHSNSLLSLFEQGLLEVSGLIELSEEDVSRIDNLGQIINGVFLAFSENYRLVIRIVYMDSSRTILEYDSEMGVEFLKREKERLEALYPLYSILVA